MAIKGTHKTDPIHKELKAIKENTKPNQLQINTNRITIFSAVVTFVLAVASIFLSIRYGENKEQIKALSKIVTGQDIQLKEIHAQSQKQDSLLNSVANLITAANVQNTNLSKQISILGLSYKTAANQLKLQTEANHLADKSSVGKLKVALSNLRSLKEKNPRTVKDHFDAVQMAQFYSLVQSVLIDESANDALNANNYLSTKWNDLLNEISARQTDMIDEYHFHINRIDKNGNNIPDAQAKASAYRPGFSEFYDHFIELFYDLEHYVIVKKIVEKK